MVSIFLSIAIILCSPVVALPLKPTTTVTVQNDCPVAKEKFLSDNTSVILDSKRTRYDFTPTEDSAYPIVVCTSISCYRYGNMTFLSGRRYNVKITIM